MKSCDCCGEQFEETNIICMKCMKAVKHCNENLKELYSVEASYHNHKETMAHAGLLLLVALVGFILTNLLK